MDRARSVQRPLVVCAISVPSPFESRLTSVLLKRSGVKRTVHGRVFWRILYFKNGEYFKNTKEEMEEEEMEKEENKNGTEEKRRQRKRAIRRKEEGKESTEAPLLRVTITKHWTEKSS